MRVLLVATAYPRHPGDGVTPWLPVLAARLRARGIGVDVLTSAYCGLGDQLADGVRVHRFRYAPRAIETLTHDRSVPAQLRAHPAALALVPGYLAAATAAAARLGRRERYDVVHALWPLPHALPGVAAARAADAALVCTWFGSELAWQGWRRRIAAPLVRASVRAADATTALSTCTASLLAGLAPEARPTIVPLGASVERDDAAAAHPAGRRDPHAPLALLHLGRLTHRKGVHVLLGALAQLPTSARVRLDVVGDGPERAALERRAAELGVADRVTFHGFVSQAAVARHLAACDALVLPTLGDVEGDVEGLGLPALEAMTFARPVIASAAGGLTDLVRDGETGLLVPPDDPAALARAIARLAADRAGAHAMGRAGREVAERSFGWDTVLDRLVGVYAEAMACRDRRRSGAARDAVQEGEVAVGDGGPAEALRRRARARAHPLGALGIAQQRADRGGERRGVAGRDEHATDGRADDLGERAGVARDERHAGGHGLHGRHPESLEARRHHLHRGAGEQGVAFGVRRRAVYFDACLQPAFGDHRAHAGPVPPPAGDAQWHIPDVAPEQHHRVEQHVEPLLVDVEAAEREQRALGAPGECEERVVRARRHDGDVGLRAEQPCELAGDDRGVDAERRADSMGAAQGAPLDAGDERAAGGAPAAARARAGEVVHGDADRAPAGHDDRRVRGEVDDRRVVLRLAQEPRGRAREGEPAPRVGRGRAEPPVRHAVDLRVARAGIRARDDGRVDAAGEPAIQLAHAHGPAAADPRVLRVVVDAVQDAERHRAAGARRDAPTERTIPKPIGDVR